MAKPRAKRKDERGPLQRAIDHERIERETAPLVNQFAEAQGNYTRNLRFVSNRGGTAIDRWKAAGYVTESQEAGILHCQRLWAQLREPNVIANLNSSGGGSGARGIEAWTEFQVDALHELGRIAAEFPPLYWDVFENVCRHDLPAGVAGSRLSNVRKAAEISARQVVCFVADIVSMKERLSY